MRYALAKIQGGLRKTATRGAVGWLFTPDRRGPWVRFPKLPKAT